MKKAVKPPTIEDDDDDDGETIFDPRAARAELKKHVEDVDNKLLDKERKAWAAPPSKSFSIFDKPTKTSASIYGDLKKHLPTSGPIAASSEGRDDQEDVGDDQFNETAGTFPPAGKVDDESIFLQSLK
eukprot:tig00000133_g7715.t1